MVNRRPTHYLLKLARIATGCLIATLLVDMGGCTHVNSYDNTASEQTPPEPVVRAGIKSESEGVDRVSPEQGNLALNNRTYPSNIKLDEPTSARPLSVAASIRPQQARAGNTITLEVRAKTAPGWHIYAVDKPTGVSVATTLKLTLPEGVTASGPWSYPEPVLDVSSGSPAYVYHGEVSFRRQLQTAGDTAAGEHHIACEFGYQVCTAVSCLAPDTIRLTVPLKVVQGDP